MRRMLALAVCAASFSGPLATGASAGGYGRVCCAPAPFIYTYPGPTYTYGGPYYFNSNLYYYRGYYPYPLPRDEWRSRRWYHLGRR
jgi:hypothetical protein